MGEYGQTIDVESRAFRRLRDDAAILRQALQLRLETRRGDYWDAPDYGRLVEEDLLDGITSDKLERIAADYKAELEKDERVRSAAVTMRVQQVAGGYQLAPSIKVFPRQGEVLEFVGPLSTFVGGKLRKDA